MPRTNVPLFIARRYFSTHRKRSFKEGFIYSSAALFLSLFTFSRKRIGSASDKLIDNFIGQNFIKILSNFSMVGVGVGTAALIVVMSVFNGLEELTRDMFRNYNPELKISPKQGKSFTVNASFLDSIESIEGVETVIEVIEDNALLRYDEKQKIVNLKGVSKGYEQYYQLDSLVPVGRAQLSAGDTLFALIGTGVQYQLSVRVGNRTNALQFWYPRAGEKFSMNPQNAFKRKAILAGGVFMIDPYYDQNNVIVPLRFAADLLDYENQRTSIEVITKGGGQTLAVQSVLQEMLGSAFDVKTLEEQQAGILRALKLERIFAFVSFIFIMAIASFNVFFTLAMLVIEKKRDMAILISMGAGKQFIKKIFLLEGSIIAFSGAAVGLAAGLTIVLLQKWFGLVSLGVQSSVIDAYPVKIIWTDFAYTIIAMIAITFLASVLPARNAGRTVVAEQL